VVDGHAALITALDTGLLRIKLKMDPNHFMWWFSEIDRNRVTVLVNDVEELTNIELSEEKN
jgi:F0F1-type ATP synthase epsilon subunit